MNFYKVLRNKTFTINNSTMTLSKKQMYNCMYVYVNFLLVTKKKYIYN